MKQNKKIITAKEAYQKSTEIKNTTNLKVVTSVWLNYIQPLINEAINNGNYYCTISKDIIPGLKGTNLDMKNTSFKSIIDFGDMNGYIVSMHSNQFVNISWAFADTQEINTREIDTLELNRG